MDAYQHLVYMMTSDDKLPRQWRATESPAYLARATLFINQERKTMPKLVHNHTMAPATNQDAEITAPDVIASFRATLEKLETDGTDLTAAEVLETLRNLVAAASVKLQANELTINAGDWQKLEMPNLLNDDDDDEPADIERHSLMDWS